MCKREEHYQQISFHKVVESQGASERLHRRQLDEDMKSLWRSG